jgi:hypothetical protein
MSKKPLSSAAELCWLDSLPLRGATVLDIAPEASPYTTRLSELAGESGMVHALRFKSLDTTFDMDKLFPNPICLARIDAGEREGQTLKWLKHIADRDGTVFIVRTGDDSEAAKLLESWGYGVRRMDGSPNVIATAR